MSRELGGAAACRFCGEPLRDTVVDLGMSPLCESYLRPDQLNAMEPFYPAPRPGLPALLARPARAVRQRRAHLHGVRVLLVVRRQLGPARP